MAKVKLLVADNVTLPGPGSIRQPGDTFEAERDDEVAQWLRLGYVEEVKAPRRRKSSVTRRSVAKRSGRRAKK